MNVLSSAESEFQSVRCLPSACSVVLIFLSRSCGGVAASLNADMASTKKRKVDSENRKFQAEWTELFCFYLPERAEAIPLCSNT